MPDDTLYHVFTSAPAPVNLADYGVPPAVNNVKRYHRTIFEARLTQEEFARIFGPNANIVPSMCQESYDEHNYTIRIFASDVLACESTHASHQGELINALRKSQGQPELDHSYIQEHARSYHDIKPRMLQILLEAAADFPNPKDLEPGEILEEMERQGLTIDDLIPETALTEIPEA